MNKNRKLVNAFLVSTMILSNVAPVALAAEDTTATDESHVMRLAGDTRVGTALEVSDFVHDSADTVVVAGYNGEVDALTGTILSAANDAPMLLVSDKAEDIAAVKAEIKALDAKNVVLLGSENVVSKAIADSFKADGLNVERVAGDDRFDTAVAVAEKVNAKHNHVFLTQDGRNGTDELADALAAGPVSGRDEDPILLTSKNGLPKQTIEALEAMDVKRVTIVGGEVAVSKVVESELADLGIAVGRVAGDNRWETAEAIAETYFGDSEEVIVANDGRTSIADALVGGYFGAEHDMPILLTMHDKMNDVTRNYLGENASFAYILGGNKVVSDAVETEIETEVAKEVGLTDAKDKAKAAVDAYELDTEDMTEESITLANAKLAELKADAKDAIDALDSIAAVEAYEFDASAAEDLLEEDALKVKSVSAINGVTVEVTFNQPVDEDAATAISAADNNNTSAVVSVEGLNLQDPKLSDDGKTLTLTSMDAVENGDLAEIKVEDAAVVVQPVVSKDDSEVKSEKYVGTMTYEDTVAPTAKAERVSAKEFKIVFSEPVKEGTATARYADGTKVDGLTFAPTTESGSKLDGQTEMTVTLGSNVTVGKDIVVTLNGVKDMAGNLINPQPTKITIVKEAKDTVAPKIDSVKQTGAKTFNIKFDKATTLTAFDGESSANTIALESYTVEGYEKVDGTDNEYKVTVTENLAGAKTLTVKKDQASNIDGVDNNENLTKLVTFVKDEEAPEATAQLVDVDGTEFIELTFDKDVELEKGTTKVDVEGKQVKDYITTEVETVNADVEYKNKDNKKVVLVKLDDAKLSVKDAKYDLTLSANADNPIESLAGENMKDVKVTFTRGADANTDVLKAEDIAIKPSGDNDKVLVEFTVLENQSLDGATATNPKNYEIDTAVIKSATLLAKTEPNSKKQVVELEIEKGSNTFTGTRNATVKNVKIAGSTKVMDPVTKLTGELVENERPTLESAKVTGSDTITLTFSEEMENLTKTAFLVKAGTEEVAQDEEGATIVDADKRKVTIKLAAGLDKELAKTITVEPAKTNAGKVDTDEFKITDLSGNALEAFDPMTVEKPGQ